MKTSPAVFISESDFIILLCSFRFNNSQRQKLYTDWRDTVLCSSLSACDRANVSRDKTTILWGADFIWICTIWFVWKHTIFRIKIRRSTPKPSHQWGVSRLNKNVRMRSYEFLRNSHFTSMYNSYEFPWETRTLEVSPLLIISHC